MREQKDSTMFIDVSDDLSATTKDLSSKWHTTMGIICKDEYIPVLQVRRFVQMIRDTCQRVQYLEVYCSLAQSPAIVIGVNIYNDAVRISSGLEELKSFADKHVTLVGEDEDQFKSVLSEIDDTLLCLMYAGESMQREYSRDEAVFSNPWID